MSSMMSSPISGPLVKYVLTAALRDKLLIALMVLIGLGISLSIFIGSAAIIEKNEFTLVFAGGGLRFSGVLGLVLFAVFHVRRSFEHKDVEFLLSRPINRVQFLFSFAVAFSILAVLLGVAVGASVAVLSPDHFSQGVILWGASIVVEFIIMVNAALFFSMWISSAATASMVTFAFYILARMTGQILAIIDHNVVNAFEGIEVAMQVVSAITPRLDLMGQTSWLLYGTDQTVDLTFILLQGVVFSSLLLLAGILDLIKRQF